MAQKKADAKWLQDLLKLPDLAQKLLQKKNEDLRGRLVEQFKGIVPDETITDKKERKKDFKLHRTLIPPIKREALNLMQKLNAMMIQKIIRKRPTQHPRRELKKP